MITQKFYLFNKACIRLITGSSADSLHHTIQWIINASGIFKV
ncbi:hypothetical protein [Candidatus Symbiopectobacterium sp.]|nr:hypothetical protein [Candidatus Symbiopectobacterium sp.]